MCEFDFSEWSVFVVHRNTLHQVQGGVSTIDHLPKDRVFAIKVWLLGVRDKELRFIRIRPGVRHSDHATVIELAASFRWEKIASGKLRTLSVDRISSAKGLPHML